MSDSETNQGSQFDFRAALKNKMETRREKASTSFETMADKDPVGTEQRKRGFVRTGGAKSTTEAIASERLGQAIDDMTDEQISASLKEFEEDNPDQYRSMKGAFDDDKSLLRALNRGKQIIN